jgi:hypothetical protein
MDLGNSLIVYLLIVMYSHKYSQILQMIEPFMFTYVDLKILNTFTLNALSMQFERHICLPLLFLIK